MSTPSPQQSKHVQNLCAAVSFLLCAIPFFHEDPFHVNYTGLFSAAPIKTALFLCVPLLYFSLRIYRSGLHIMSRSSWQRECLVLFVLTVTLCAVPYRREADLSTNLHLLLALICFLDLNRLLFYLLWPKKTLSLFYYAMTFTAFFVALLSSSINGWSELVYALALCVTVSRI